MCSIFTTVLLDKTVDELREPKRVALLLPADGTEIRLVSYDIAYREADDLCVDADFYDPIPYLRPWLGDAFNERLMLTFHVYHRSRGKQDPITRTFIQSDDPRSHSRYSLCYTLSPTQTLNESCKRLANVKPLQDRLFWRGDVLVTRYEGDLGMGHEYLDVSDQVVPAVAYLMTKSFESRGLERLHEREAAELELRNKLNSKLYSEYKSYVFWTLNPSSHPTTIAIMNMGIPLYLDTEASWRYQAFEKVVCIG